MKKLTCTLIIVAFSALLTTLAFADHHAQRIPEANQEGVNASISERVTNIVAKHHSHFIVHTMLVQMSVISGKGKAAARNQNYLVKQRDLPKRLLAPGQLID